MPADWLFERIDDAMHRGDHRAAAQLCTHALASWPATALTARARAARLLALNLWRLGDHESAMRHASRALGMSRALGDRAGEAGVLVTRAMLSILLALHREAFEDATAALAIARELGDRRLECWALNRVGVASQHLADPATGESWLLQALMLARALVAGEEEEFAALNNLATCRLFLAQQRLESRDNAGAREAVRASCLSARDAVALARRSGNSHRLVVALGNLASALTLLDEGEAALEAIVEYQALARANGYGAAVIEADFDGACLLRHEGRHALALQRLEVLLPRVVASEDHELALKVEHALYDSCKALGRFEEALAHHEAWAARQQAILVQRAESQARVLLERLEIERQRRELASALDDVQRERAHTIELEAEHARLRAEAEALDRAAHEDALTRLPNRRAAEASLAGWLRRSAEAAEPLPVGVAMLDVDHFKAVNDRFGHAVGDRVLAELGDLLRGVTREADRVARVGGEEFLLVLPGATPLHAHETCERLRATVQAHDWTTIAAGLAVTISVGLAAAVAGDDFASATARADAALYEAKRAGRNRVHAG